MQAKDGDIFLLCSDGLSGMVSDANMQRVIAESKSLEDTAKALVEAANSNGGRDNITAVLFRLEDDGSGDPRRADTEAYETIPGNVQAPTTEEVEAARSTAAGTIEEPRRADPPRAPPNSQLPTPIPADRPRRAASRRGRLYARAVTALVVLLLIAGGGLYFLVHSVWFLGTNRDGVVTLYRGLPYDLPLGVHLYSQRYVSGVPALSLAPDRRKRVLDHQLRSKNDAVDLIRSLGIAGSR